MNRMKRRMSWILLLVMLLMYLTGVVFSSDNTRISEFGVYQGYSEPIYDGWIRESRYIIVRDGTRLAVDIFRPTRNGVVAEEPLPVIWAHHRYHRGMDLPDGIFSLPLMADMVKPGYIVASVDVRGGGASFGTRSGEFTVEEARDAYDITEWFAAQTWCTGRIGMFGLSYLAGAQYMAAGMLPPHLVAIFPEKINFDLYEFAYTGGVLRNSFINNWGQIIYFLDKILPGEPVSEDIDRSLLMQAQMEHQGNLDAGPVFAGLSFRDSMIPFTFTQPYLNWGPSILLNQIRASRVAVYNWGGWYDPWPRDTLLYYENLKDSNPGRVTIGPWNHNTRDPLVLTEMLRWFDYWLKGIDNGIMNEDPIHYYTMGEGKRSGWHSAKEWPLPEAHPVRLYFQSGHSHSVQSVNDSRLELAPPNRKKGKDHYTVDYTTTSGAASRWTHICGGPFGYEDMKANDVKALTYTTDPLRMETEVTGHPIVRLWVDANVSDVDFFVYLEDVDENGVSNYVTEGVLRASHRVLSTPMYRNFRLPYHRSNIGDITPLSPKEPAELVFELIPTSYIFARGHRIRVAVTCADCDNALTPVLTPAPEVSVHRSAKHPSCIELPVVMRSHWH